MKHLTFRQRRTWIAHLFKAVMYQHHKPFAAIARSLLGEDAVIVDVGGHAGQFTKLFSRIAPRGHVYTFEPGSYALSILRKVARAHRLHNVTIIPSGLSDSVTTAALNVPIKKSGSVGFGISHIATGEVANTTSHSIALTTLDTMMQERHVLRLDFIKMDIEGWEFHALKGAKDAITKFRPSVMLEVVEASLARASATAQDIFALLGAQDYRVFRIDEHQGYRHWAVNGFEGDGDYLFVPNEKAGLLSCEDSMSEPAMSHEVRSIA